MHVFHFKTFLNNLHCDAPTHEGIPTDSPLIVYFSQDDDLTKHEMLRRFNNLLRKTEINWIRPLKELTSEWLLDLKEFKSNYEILKDVEYLKGKLTLEPEYIQSKECDEYSDQIISIKSIIKFSIYPEDTRFLISRPTQSFSNELDKPLERFLKDFSEPNNCVFLIMKFEDTPLQKQIITTLRQIFKEYGYYLLRADDKWYSDDLFGNIKTYMHGCGFGLALFERINSNYFNPNVSLEIGYMMALSKPILFLKDRTLQSLHSDLIGKLYSEFDCQDYENTLKKAVSKWLQMNELILPAQYL